MLENSIGLGTQSPFYQLLVTNHPLRKAEELPIVTFSGGVADCLNTQVRISLNMETSACF